jgi:hypothetical protein
MNSDQLRAAIWSEWQWDITTKSRLARSMPFALMLAAKMSRSFAGVE